MNKQIIHPDKILIRINSEDRRNLFEKDIVRHDGTVVSLVTSIASSPDEENYFTQSVQVGDVIGVGSNITWVKEGDKAVLDYTVDINEENIAYVNSGKDKVVCILAETKYHNTEFYVPANRNRPFDQFVYRKGDIDFASMLIGIIRDGVVMPNFPYILLAYREVKTTHILDKGGMYLMETKEQIIERVVIAVNSKSKIKVGDIVVVDSDSLFDRNTDGKLVSVVYEHDILATSKKLNIIEL